MEIRVHQPGQLDFQIVTKDVSVTEFRRKPSAVWDYLKTTVHVIFFTCRGKRDCAIMSIETHVSYKDLKGLMADLKAVYAAVDEPSALIALDTFEATWGKKYPRIAASWRKNWANLSTYFKFPQEIRQLIYTTNTIEGFNRQLRKVTKAKAVFPTDDSLLKMLYLAMVDITKKRTGRRQDWRIIHAQLAIYYADRMPG